LPDDQPGYTMGEAAKARWALRRLLATTPPTPSAPVVVDALISLRRDTQEKLDRALAEKPNDKQTALVLRTRLNAIQDCINAALSGASTPVRVSWADFWIAQGDWQTANDYAAFEKAEQWLLAQQPAAAGEESSKGADVARPKRRPYNTSGSLSEYGVFPECDAQQQPAEGEDIMVNTPYDVFTLPLQPSGLSSGPRFVVHVPGPEALAKHQPCGCVLCTCEDEKQCQGCGAKFCGNRTDHPAYVKQQPAAVFRNDGNTEDDFIAHEANACTACGGSGHKADQQPA